MGVKDGALRYLLDRDAGGQMLTFIWLPHLILLRRTQLQGHRSCPWQLHGE